MDAQVVSDGLAISTNEETVLFISEPFSQSNAVAIDLFDELGFVDSIPMASLGSSVVGFSNVSLTTNSFLIGEVVDVNANLVIGVVVITVNPATHREQACKIVDGGHIQSDHVDDFPDADLDGDGKIEGQAELDILKDLLEGTMDDAGANNTKTDAATGRIAYWDPDTEVIVIYDPRPNKPGTAFKPTRNPPRDYFDSWPNV